jgi:hypothetical protein
MRKTMMSSRHQGTFLRAVSSPRPFAVEIQGWLRTMRRKSSREASRLLQSPPAA